MAVVTLHRSAWGLDSDRADPWWTRVACARTGELHLAEPKQGPTGAGTPQAKAVHICLHHCPVLRQCREDTLAHPPRGMTQGGLVWRDGANTRRPRPAQEQPPDPGCGPWCAHLRGDQP